MSLFNLSNHADLRRHEEVYASPKASFVFSGTGPNHGECHGPVSNQRNKEIVVRFGLGRKRNIVGFIPESNPTVNSVPRVAPSGSETTLRCTRGRGRTAAREATRLRREVAAWRARSRRGGLAACIPTGEHSCPASPSPSVSLQ
jgi:hypothetical protein